MSLFSGRDTGSVETLPNGKVNMKGHVQDRWYRHKKDANNKLMYTSTGRPVREKTELYGKGLRYKVHYYDEENNERSKSFPDKAKGKADDFLLKMQHDVLSGEYIDPNAGDVTFRKYTAQWLKGQSSDASTRHSVNSKLKTGIFPFLGDKSLSVVEKTDTIRNWLEWMEKPKSEGGRGLQASYRALLFGIVSAILQSACDDRKIRRNPCKVKSIKKPKGEQKKVVPWSNSRVRSVQLALPREYSVIVPLGAGLALRQMEIFGLSPDDINREEMIVRVQRQIRWVDNRPVFAPPKGGKTREVPLGEGVLGEVDKHLEQFDPVSVTLPWLEPNGRPVTVNLLIRKAKPRTRYFGERVPDVIDGANFTYDVWKDAFDAAGLDYTPYRDGMHAMRHFCASVWLANGVSIKEVAEYLGHHDPGYTLKIYTHLVPSSHARARSAVNTVFVPKQRSAAG
ncbi:tyrosine-type recombinase/integrase [Amycolatopsis albispora]|uniref:tyrosine-type recombinase/integrase n=1 Tax=Amycolatopsis albispora TaxID=1804986 RepID=UPI001F021A3F|nr:tyrosine-type recombinase/integrase [Amycolatopsis albispora]